MATDQELILKIRADADKAIKEINSLNKEVASLTKEVSKNASSLKKQKSAFDGISKSVNSVSDLLGKVTLGLGGLGVVMKGIEFSNLAADAEQAADAFDKVVTEMGYVAEEEFNKIKEASKGLISDADIKQSAVTAISLGVPLEKLAGLMEVARAKSREMGTDAASAFNDLATGIGRGSPMILDNLGLTIKLEEANQKYAASIDKSVDQLTKQEKQIALTNAVIEAAKDSVKRFSDAGLSAREENQKFQASLENLKTVIGSALLTPLKQLTIATGEFIDKVTEKEKVDLFSESVRVLGEAYKYASDQGVFDSIKDSFFDSVGLGVAQDAYKTADAIFKMASEAYNLSIGLDNVTKNIDGVNHAFENMDRSRENLVELRKSTYDVIQEAEKLKKSYELDGSDKAKAAALQLGQQITKLKDNYKELGEEIKADYDKKKKLADATIQYTEAEIKELKKLNDQRVKDAEKSIKSLEKSEEKLASDIVKINEKLLKDLAKIANDRFKMNQDIESQIADLKRGALSEDAAYYDKQKEAERALSDAKIALKQGEYEKYKYFIDQYQTLVTDSAGQEIKVNDQVAVSADETRRRGIEGLKKVQDLENTYYDKKKADAQAAHDLTIQQKQAELEATKAQLVAQKELLTVLKEMTQQLTGNEVSIDTSAIDAAIAKVNSTKASLASLSTAPGVVNVDSTNVDSAKRKVEELKTVTINGITLKVDADTTPADFGLKKLINKSDGEEITMDVNPDYYDAQKKLDAFRNGEKNENITVGVDANTSAADAEIGTLKKPTKSEHTVKANDRAAVSAINKLKQPTSSVHTIYEKIVPARAHGGPIPQKLATGGTFRGSGRVPGYDPTDSDKVNALLTGGEFVIRRKAVDAIGLPALHDINNMRFKVPKLPRYAEGGLVGAATKSSSVPGLGNLGTLTLSAGGNSYPALVPREVAEALQAYIGSEGGL